MPPLAPPPTWRQAHQYEVGLDTSVAQELSSVMGSGQELSVTLSSESIFGNTKKFPQGGPKRWSPIPHQKGDLGRADRGSVLKSLSQTIPGYL